MQDSTNDTALYREVRHEQREDDHTDLYTHTVKTRSKVFYFDFRENDNGRYLKITEKSGVRRNQIMVPAEGLEEFKETLLKVVELL